RASAGRGFRAPSLAERFVSTFVQGIPVVPNPDLDPETAWSFELGNAATLSSAVRTDAALFWTEAYDLIEPTVDSGRIQFKNVTHARLAGLDLAVTATPPVAGLTTTLSYTFLHARALAHDSVSERPLAFRPRHLLTLGAVYQRGVIGVGGDFRYTSRLARVEIYVTDPRVAEKGLDTRVSGRPRPPPPGSLPPPSGRPPHPPLAPCRSTPPSTFASLLRLTWATGFQAVCTAVIGASPTAARSKPARSAGKAVSSSASRS